KVGTNPLSSPLDLKEDQ
ncbi:unnamed protein product, partial [Rhizophagus irregularis]